MDPSMLTPEMMAFAQKQMANMTPEQMVRGPRSRDANDRAGCALPRPSSPRRGGRRDLGDARAVATRAKRLSTLPCDDAAF
jgi:hypothetical protein